MKLSATQHAYLQWLHDNGGRAELRGAYLIAGSKKTNCQASLPFLHLCQKGAIEGKDGYLQITDYGRRLLTP